MTRHKTAAVSSCIIFSLLVAIVASDVLGLCAVPCALWLYWSLVGGVIVWREWPRAISID